MILHLVDDEKFIDATINHFEHAAPNSNLFVILSQKTSKSPLKYIKDQRSVILSKPDMKTGINDFIDQYGVQAVFIHYLSEEKIDAIAISKRKYPDLKLVWFFWGEDGFGLQRFQNNMYQVKTKRLLPYLNKKSLFKKFVLKVLLAANKSGLYIKDYFPKERKKINLIKKVNYIVPVIKQDLDLYRSKYNTTAKYLSWNYLSIPQMVGNNLDVRADGNNILLGNSASATNNHIEVIDLLKDIDLKGRKVIVPLSYGNTRYRDLILEYGSRHLKDSFYPLIDFLSNDEYNKILRSCKYVIMNHNRQQAMGNIVATLWMGAKLFINEHSTMYQYFTEMGIQFYSINDYLIKKTNSLNEALSEEMIQQNRIALNKEWGPDVIAEKTSSLLRNFIQV